MNLSELQEDPKNPRRISGKRAEGLRKSLEEFGDISGIVVNETTGHLVSGHQRRKQILSKYGDLKVERKPGNEFGEIKAPDGNVFRVRYVTWSIEKQKAANIAANAQTISGQFTESLDDLLDEVAKESPEIFQDLFFDEVYLNKEKEIEVILDEAKYDSIELEEQPTGKLPPLTWILVAVETEKIDEYEPILQQIRELEPKMLESTVSYR